MTIYKFKTIVVPGTSSSDMNVFVYVYTCLDRYANQALLFSYFSTL